MKLKTVRTVTGILIALTLLLYAAFVLTRLMVFAWTCFGAAILMLVFWLAFWKCPYCGEFLGRDRCKYCRHCGAKLDL